MQAPVINADTVQMYQDVRIGSAQPDWSQWPDLRHYLFEVIPPGERWTAADYVRNVLSLIEAESETSAWVFAGGSGFYVRALENGMFSAGAASEEIMEDLHAEKQTKGLSALYQELMEVDPESAEVIHENDEYRILRALGIFRTYGRRTSELRRQGPDSNEGLLGKGAVIKFALRWPREQLRERVEHRTRRMLQAGWIEEVQGLRARGLGEWWPLQSVGYKEVQEFLDGQIEDRETLIERVVQRTMQLAKKQMTWLNREPNIHWLDAPDFNLQQVLKTLKGNRS